MNNELQLLQLVDSASPTGAFTHSFGMETAFKENKLQNADDLFEWMIAYLSGSLAPTEGAAVYMSYHIVQTWLKEQDKQLDKIQLLDKKLYLSKIPKESRDGAMKIGKRYLKIVDTLYPNSQLSLYKEWLSKGDCFGHSAIVHGWISAYLDITCHTALYTYLYNSINNQLQTALRLTAVGQTDVQIILHRLYPIINEKVDHILITNPTIDDLFSFSIIQEIEAMRHETLYSRLFMS